MEWLKQNWASLLILAVVLLFLTRRGGIGCGIGRSARGRSADALGASNSDMPATAITLQAEFKRMARLNLLRDILSRLHYAGRKDKFVRPDPDIVFEFSPDCLETGRLTR